MNKFLVALGLGALMWVVPAGAQTTMKFDIPFSFVAGDRVVPAGTYRVTVDDHFNLARLDSTLDREVRVVRLVPGTTSRAWDHANAGGLQFTKQGEQFFLTGVWKPGSIAGNATVPSKRQIEATKTAAVQVVNVNSN